MNTLQLEHFIQIDRLAKDYFTAMYAQSQFFTRADKEIKKGIYIKNDQSSTFPGQHWLLISINPERV